MLAMERSLKFPGDFTAFSGAREHHFSAAGDAVVGDDDGTMVPRLLECRDPWLISLEVGIQLYPP